MPEVLNPNANDIMGRIDAVAAWGIPRELLILLSAGLLEAGKAAQQTGTPVELIAEWCRQGILEGTASAEQTTSLGIPPETMAQLADVLAGLGRYADGRGARDRLADFAFDLMLTGRRAEQVATAGSLREKWQLRQAHAA
jgi:hypothetical protein